MIIAVVAVWYWWSFAEVGVAVEADDVEALLDTVQRVAVVTGAVVVEEIHLFDAVVAAD